VGVYSGTEEVAKRRRQAPNGSGARMRLRFCAVTSADDAKRMGRSKLSAGPAAGRSARWSRQDENTRTWRFN
jgi:hypothetical protein